MSEMNGNCNIGTLTTGIDWDVLAEKVNGKSASGHGGVRENSGGRRPGAGRKPGVPNKLSGDLKAMILDALGREGGVEYLREVAQEDRKAFCALLGRVLPMTVQGDPENPLSFMIVSSVPRGDERS